MSILKETTPEQLAEDRINAGRFVSQPEPVQRVAVLTQTLIALEQFKDDENEEVEKFDFKPIFVMPIIDDSDKVHALILGKSTPVHFTVTLFRDVDDAVSYVAAEPSVTQAVNDFVSILNMLLNTRKNYSKNIETFKGLKEVK